MMQMLDVLTRRSLVSYKDQSLSDYQKFLFSIRHTMAITVDLANPNQRL